MAEKENGKWVTINGRHIFIPEGKTLDDVLNSDDNKDYEADVDEQGPVRYNKKTGLYDAYDEKGNMVGRDFSTDRDAYDYLDSNNDKYKAYNEKGKSTWNQKLQRGDKVTIKDRNGNEIEGFINGFFYKGELQNEDTYEEGKDNSWHDFRGLNLVDDKGRDIGNINANQIIKHERM